MNEEENVKIEPLDLNLDDKVETEDSCFDKIQDEPECKDKRILASALHGTPIISEYSDHSENDGTYRSHSNLISQDTCEKKQNCCTNCLDLTKLFGTFLMRFSNKMLNYDTHRLAQHEPQYEKIRSTRYCKQALMGIAGLAFCLSIVLGGVKKIGTLKSQELRIEKHTNLTYSMTYDLFPVYLFTLFPAYQIRNRIECLYNQQSEPCIKYCDDLFGQQSRKKLYDCYANHYVPTKIYGK